MAEQSKDTNSTLFRIAGVGAAIAFGAMVASLFAVRSTPGGLAFNLTAPAVIAFFVCAVIAWFYWRLIARMAENNAPTEKRKRFVLFSFALLVVGVVAFAYPLRFIPAEKRADVFTGLALAVGVIIGVGFVMWQVKKFLDADQKSAEDNDRSKD